jgi:hypothetical protein
MVRCTYLIGKRRSCWILCNTVMALCKQLRYVAMELRETSLQRIPQAYSDIHASTISCASSSSCGEISISIWVHQYRKTRATARGGKVWMIWCIVQTILQVLTIMSAGIVFYENQNKVVSIIEKSKAVLISHH